MNEGYEKEEFEQVDEMQYRTENQLQYSSLSKLYIYCLNRIHKKLKKINDRYNLTR
jgi:hypothetical protein